MKFSIRIQEALSFAEIVHQYKLYNGKKYMNHIMDCYNLGLEYCLTEDLLIPIILHDVLKTDQTLYSQIKKKFGKEVAEIVYSVTDELGRNRKERRGKTYPKINNSKSITVKLIDRLANVSHSYNTDNLKKLKLYKKENDELLKILNNNDHCAINYLIFNDIEELLEDY